MSTIYAGVHVKNKLSDFYPVHNIDMGRNVAYLKMIIAEQLQLQFDASELDVCYSGKMLSDDCQLSSTIKPNAVVHCFRKMKACTPYEPPAPNGINTKHIQELFSLTSHLQISVTSRFNILQKILAEYPEFRRNLGAQALIRDSVLFNMLHEPEVVQNLVRHYPLICDAASFIVDTIRKELARNSSATQFQEQAASESTISSEEENSLGAGSSSSGGSTSTAAATLAAIRREEIANIRQISRQQLANALARVDMSSFNSLSNIAQRNVDEALSDERPRTSTSTTTSGIGSSAAAAIATATAAATATATATAIATATAAATATTAAGTAPGGGVGVVSSELLRNEIARALQSLQQQPLPTVESMDVETSAPSLSESAAVDEPEDDDESASGADSDVLPRCYRRHRFTEQLRTMAAMGFLNHTQNVNYLTLADGNVEHAINLLMLGMN